VYIEASFREYDKQRFAVIVNLDKMFVSLIKDIGDSEPNKDRN